MADEEEDDQDIERFEADKEEDIPDSDDDEQYIPDPDRCPACTKKYKNILLHIRKTPTCYSEVGPELYNSVKITRNKKKKNRIRNSLLS